MASSAAAKYQVRWRPVGAEAWSRPRDFPVRDEIEVDGLDRGTEYEFEVRAVSACGAASVWVPENYTVPAPPALPPPTVPTTKPGPDGIDLDWGGGEDGVRGDLTYEIQRAKILGAYASAAALVAAHPTGEAGDAYFVGSAVYGWDGAGWVDIDVADNPAWTTVAKTKSTTWTDVVLDTDQYTYRIRSIDYNGNVSDWVVIGQAEAAVVSTIEFQDQTAQQITELLQADAEMAQDIIDQGTELAQVVADQAVLRAQIGDILQADEWVSTATYPLGDLVQHEGKLYRSLIDDNVDHEPSGVTDAYWEALGNYASLGEAVAATAAQVAVHTVQIDEIDGELTAVSETVDQHAARMPAGTGELATEASVTAVESASVTRDSALGARVEDIEVRMPAGAGELATASALSATQATVSSQGATISTHSSQISSLQTEIAGKASTSAVNALDSRVDSVEGQITATASDVTALSATVGSQSASITQISQVVATGGGNGLNIPNPGFEYSFGWGGGAGTGTPSETLDSQSGYTTNSPHSGSYCMRFGDGASGVTATRFNSTRDLIPVDSSRKIRAVGWSRVTQGPSGSGSELIQLRAYDASGSYIRVPTEVRTPLSNHGWTRRVTPWVSLPAGTAYIRVGVGVSGADAPLYCYWDDISVEVQSTTDEAALATVGLVLDVNGRVTGYRLTNDGTTGDFTVLADRFQIVNPAGGARTEFSNGNWRVYDSGGTMRVRLGVWT